MKMSSFDRLLLLLTGLLAAYQIAIGISAMSALPIVAYTVGFGVLLVAALLLVILGFEALESPIVVTVSAVIPLSLSLGLVWEHLPAFRVPYLAFACVGFLAIGLTRLLPVRNKIPVVVLAAVHAAAGLIIFILPLALVLTGRAVPDFALVGVGGALIGAGGLLLTLQEVGKPLLKRPNILVALPGLLFLTTAAFVAGFRFG